MADNPPPEEMNYAKTPEEAEARAKQAYDTDPFLGVMPSLLSTADVARYVSKTGMLFPFNPKKLKTASYEMRPGGRFIYWEKKGLRTIKRDIPIDRSTRYLTLPKNSISFIEVEPYFRLPLYIAVRFNLRIKHVHRGLLLGTGPLVDPGFDGKILIPVHNLTSTDYELNLDATDDDDGLIWVEFTKTTFDKDRDKGTKFDDRKKGKSADYYLQKANAGNPIQSSIVYAVEDARRRAETASNLVKVLTGFGVLAILGVVYSVYSLVQNASSHVTAAQGSQVTIERDIGDMKARMEQLAWQVKEQTSRADALAKQLAAMRSRPPASARPAPPHAH